MDTIFPAVFENNSSSKYDNLSLYISTQNRIKVIPIYKILINYHLAFLLLIRLSSIRTYLKYQSYRIIKISIPLFRNELKHL